MAEAEEEIAFTNLFSAEVIYDFCSGRVYAFMHFNILYSDANLV